MMLDDEYGGLLLEGKPTLFKNQSMMNSSIGSSSLFSNKSSAYPAAAAAGFNNNSLSRASAVTNNFGGGVPPTSTGSGVHPPSGFKPVQKQWIQSQPMSPRGDESCHH